MKNRTQSVKTGCAVVALAALLCACQRTQLPACQQLTSAIAGGSSKAMVAATNPRGAASEFKTALLAAAREASEVNLRTTQAPYGMDLNGLRAAYVVDLQKLSSEITVTGPTRERRQLITVTAQAIDGVSLRCSGER